MTGSDAQVSLKSIVMKRSIIINNHKTSVSLEEPFWQSVKDIAHARNMRVADLVKEIDSKREHANLSSAIRLYVFSYYRSLQIVNSGPRLEDSSALTPLP